MLKRLIVFLPLILLLLAACDDASSSPTAPLPAATGGDEAEQLAGSPPQPTAVLEPTATTIPPSPTPEEPLAATVNGEPIYLSAYEEALARQEQGQALVLPGAVTTDEQADVRTQVLDMLIEQALIEQAAAEFAIAVTPQMVDEEIAALREERETGEGSFEEWLASNQWTEAEFREALAYQMLATQVSTLVTADVPDEVQQVRARYLQVDDPDLAASLRQQVAEGADFAALAQQYSLDRSTAEDGGDLGYFSQGSLLVPEIEAAAFALEPGGVSEVISATVPAGEEATYYLVQVVDVDPERPLNAQMRAMMLEERFEQWLAQQWAEAEIVRFVDT